MAALEEARRRDDRVKVEQTEDEKRRGVKLTPWPNNAARHSFCSYHLAQHQDAAQLALQAGNSPQMIFQHYRELVRPTEAAKWWEIRPKEPPTNESAEGSHG